MQHTLHQPRSPAMNNVSERRNLINPRLNAVQSGKDSAPVIVAPREFLALRQCTHPVRNGGSPQDAI